MTKQRYNTFVTQAVTNDTKVTLAIIGDCQKN